MSNLDHESQINQILNIEKLLSISFPAIAFLQYYAAKYSGGLFTLQYSLIIVSLLLAILLVYYLWSYLQEKVSRTVKQWLDIGIPTLFALGAILLTGAYESNYKFLFFFVVISSSIECSRNISLAISVVVAVLTLCIDLFLAPSMTINPYFESDMILACAFFIISWVISYYVDMRKKSIQLLQDQSINDGLTGLKNHRYFYDYLEKLMQSAEADAVAHSLLFIDLDDFKCYNDLYGHQRGDDALRSISGIMKELFPEPAVVARYGGEEFAILLPHVGETEALERAEILRARVQDHVFPGEERLPRRQLTISVGVSSYPDKAKTGADLVKNADEACYRAKFLYKNRVETYYSVLDRFSNSETVGAAETISSIKTLIAVINAKDRYTYGHVERVVFYCALFAEKLDFSEEEKNKLIFAAYLHDIGKINIPESILMKTDPLTREEWELLRSHPQKAEEIIRNIASLQDMIPIVLQHHERYDGSGYPYGLKGDELQYLSRVLTVVDSFDAMTSNRPYQARKSYKEAVEELKRCSGTQFDPEIAARFIDLISPIIALNMDSSANMPVAW